MIVYIDTVKSSEFRAKTIVAREHKGIECL